MTELNVQSLPDSQLCCQLVVLSRDCLDLLLSGMQALLRCSLVILMLLQRHHTEFKLETMHAQLTELRQEC